MFVQVQTVDGQLFQSDEVVSDDTNQVEFQKAVDSFINVMQNLGVADGFWLTINGNERYFNPRNILWAELV
jgi:hypothetical protein